MRIGLASGLEWDVGLICIGKNCITRIIGYSLSYALLDMMCMYNAW